MVWNALRGRGHEREATRRTCTPALETLEDRTAPAVSASIASSFDPSTATWYLHSSNAAGAADLGSFKFGAPGWVGVTGDWTGAGKAGIGVFDPATATWYLRNETDAGAPDAGKFTFGPTGSIPVVGDWNKTGHAGIGVFDPNTATFYLRNEVGAGTANAGEFKYGMVGWRPIAGDWSGSGKSGIGVFDPDSATFYLRNESNAGAPDAGKFVYGTPGWQPLAGDWTGTGRAGIGVLDPTTATFFLRGKLSAGPADAGQFQFGAPGWQGVAGNFVAAATPAAGTKLLTVKLNPLNINLLGLEVRTDPIEVTVTAQPGQGALLGNLLTTVSNLINLQGVNNALNNVLGSVVTLLNSTSLSVAGVNTTSGPFSSAATVATTPVLNLYVAPVHLNLLGALVDTSPIHLTITARSGQGLILGNAITELANLFNPPLPAQLDLNFINAKLQDLLAKLNAQIPNIGSAPISTPPIAAGSEQVLSLAVPPIDLNLLGLVLKTSQIRVNVNALSGNGNLLGNVVTDLLHTLGATPQNLTALSNNLNAVLAKVVGVLNVSSLILPANAISSLSQVLQDLSVPTLINASGTASAPILNLAIASTDGTSPPVDVNLLGLVVTTSNIRAQLIAQTGNGQVLGNLLYNVANLLNPGGSLNLLAILNALGL